MFKKLMTWILICAVVIGTGSDLTAKGKSYSSGRSSSSSKTSGRSYSTSKPAYKAPASKPPAYKAPSASKPATSKKYSATPATPNPAPNSRKPESSTFNNSLSNSAKHVESQKKYETAQPKPKPTYTPPGSKVSKPISPVQSQTVNKYVTHERYVTYENRSSTFYRGYQPYYYNDCFSPFLMGWILSDAMNTHDRAAWMYHHQSEMDQSRYNELLSKDAKLQAEIDQLKSQNIKPDAGYIPVQMAENPDLMFNKEFVDASVAEKTTLDMAEKTTLDMAEETTLESGVSIFWGLVLLIVVCIAIYIFFVKEW